MGYKSKLPVFFLVFSLFVSFTLAYDSGSKLQRCIKQCQEKKNDYSQIRQCIDRCQRDADDVDVATESSRSSDPRQELEECRDLCRTQRWSTDLVHRCEKKCEDKFERQQGRGGGSDDDDQSDRPRQLLEECRYLCRIRKSGPDMVRHCEKECEDAFERMQRGGGSSDEDNLERKSEKSQQELEECRDLCRSRRSSMVMVDRCMMECEVKFERQQRGGGSSDEDKLELKSEKPQQELEECQDLCRRKRWSMSEVHRCEKKCKDKFEDSNHHEISGERKYEQCQRKCEKEGHRGQSEQWQCQKRCQEEFEREGGGESERGGDEGERGHQGHDSEKEMRRCRERCEEQGYGYDCDKRCRHQSHGGGRRSQDGFISVVSALFG